MEGSSDFKCIFTVDQSSNTNISSLLTSHQTLNVILVFTVFQSSHINISSLLTSHHTLILYAMLITHRHTDTYKKAKTYPPTATSSDEDIEKFCKDTETPMKQTKSHKVTVIVWDFNANVTHSITQLKTRALIWYRRGHYMVERVLW